MGRYAWKGTPCPFIYLPATGKPIGGWVWVDRPRRGHLVLLSVYLLLVNLLGVGYG